MMMRAAGLTVWFSFSGLVLMSCSGVGVTVIVGDPGEDGEDSEHERNAVDAAPEVTDDVYDIESDTGDDVGEGTEDAPVGCDNPLESWHRRVTQVDHPMKNIAKVRENDETWIVTGYAGMLGGDILLYKLTLSGGVPSATPVAVNTSGLTYVSPQAASRLNDMIVAMNPPYEAQPAQAILFNTNGEVIRRGPVDFVLADWLFEDGDGAMAMSEDRIAIATPDGSGTIHVGIIDYELASIIEFQLERHSIARVRTNGSAFLLATINVISDTLEIFELNDSGIGSAIFTRPVTRTLHMAWAGEQIVLTDPARQLILVTNLDGTEQTAPFPPEAADEGLVFLTAAESPYGLALGAITHNIPFVGLLRPDGSMEWQAAPEEGVFSLVHAEEKNVGVYYVATFGDYNRSLTYLGFYCDPDA